MRPPVRLWIVAALSFAFTWLFFLDYLPPLKRIHVPYDLEYYYYPLADYAFQQLREGRFPQWDAAIYCGMPFAGNIQAALFYPPIWLLYAAHAGRHALLYKWLEILVFLHVWLAFLLCFTWLRRKGLADLASALGAAVFAYGGYLLMHLQHFGVAAGYVWMPLGFWGIDEVFQQQRWRPLWKTAAASALCFLAGYAPLWFVFAVCMLVYAARRWRVLAGVAAALAVSLAIAAVQLLPAWEAAALMVPELNYGSGIRDPLYLLFYLLPNFSDWALSATGRLEDPYLYLGPAALLGFVYLARSRDRRAAPLLAVAGVALILLTNPFNLVWEVIRHIKLLAQICRDWYFLAGLHLAAAPLAALGLDSALKRKRPPAAGWATLAAAGLLAAWSLRQILVWAHDGLAAGWLSGWELGVSFALCFFAIRLLPGQRGVLRTILSLALLTSVGVDYKIYGAARRFNAAAGPAAWTGRSLGLPAVDEAVDRRLREHAEYRVAMDLTGPLPADLRHHGLSSPQGFDPFLTRQYRELIENVGRFRTNREIDLDPANQRALRLLGVRYLFTAEGGPFYPQLSTSPHFRLLEPSADYYKVFEYLHARPPYGWTEGVSGSARLLARTPETRAFVLRSPAGGRFTLSEQFFPGWQATVDGAPVRIERWSGAFQAVEAPAGEHRLEFRYRSPGLVPGACISLAAILLSAVFCYYSRLGRAAPPPQPATPSPPARC